MKKSGTKTQHSMRNSLTSFKLHNSWIDYPELMKIQKEIDQEMKDFQLANEVEIQTYAKQIIGNIGFTLMISLILF